MRVGNIEVYTKEFESSAKPDGRYSSFDYCYNYFRTTDDFEADIEKSCLVLGFYLASWGMLRGSSFLLQKSVKHFEPLIRHYASLDKGLWEIDVDNYSDGNISKILELYKETKELVVVTNSSHLTLVTKILMGVFGIIPAFDQYFLLSMKTIFKDRCGFSTVNYTSLKLIREFYESNKSEIDIISKETYTIDFKTSNSTTINYPKTKIIDMYGFIDGFKKSNYALSRTY